ncbi:hypothetical protein KIN20_036843, partial [Parelaphostrongylus tenuis]
MARFTTVRTEELLDDDEERNLVNATRKASTDPLKTGRISEEKRAENQLTSMRRRYGKTVMGNYGKVAHKERKDEKKKQRRPPKT